MNFVTIKKSMDLLDASLKEFQQLDIPRAYTAALESLEANPSNFKVFYYLKTLAPVAAAGYPEIFEGERLVKATTKAVRINPENPFLNYLLGSFYKLMGLYRKAEESFFKAVFHNRDVKSPETQAQYLFELAFTYRNRSLFDVFNRLTFSIDWNMDIFKATGRTALPREITGGRVFSLDFSIGVMANLREMLQSPEKLYFLCIPGNLPDPKTFWQYLRTFKQHGIDFYLYHTLPFNYVKKEGADYIELGKYIPWTPEDCPAAANVNGYSIIICPMIRNATFDALRNLYPTWNVKVEKKLYCRCQ